MKRTIIALCIAALSVPAFAGTFSSARSSSFSSSRSFSSPSVSRSSSYWGTPKPTTPSVPRYTAPSVPKPVAGAPAPARNVTINRTTVVQQAAVQQSSSSGGFMSSFVGSMAGAGIANWLFAPKPQAAPAPEVIDCARQPLPVEWAKHCPASK